jgi:hypothetical protein
MVGTDSQRRDPSQARSDTEAASGDEAQFSVVSRDEVPKWLTLLRVPPKWRAGHLEGGGPPWRIAVCGQRADGGWDGCETIAVLQFTGFPSIETIRRHSQQVLRQARVGTVETTSLAIPPVDGVHALRSSGHCRAAGREIWAQYSFFVAGSTVPHAGRLIQQCIFAEASRLAALKDGLHRLSDALHNGFIAALNDDRF